MGINASEVTVREYLKDDWGLSEEAVTRIVNEHREILDTGIRLRSYAYYVGNEIVKAAYGSPAVIPIEDQNPDWEESDDYPSE